jgi:rare lipoprotein A (peptidoglycan hydrolase)
MGLIGISEVRHGFEVAELRVEQVELDGKLFQLGQTIEELETRVDNLTKMLGQAEVEDGLASWYGPGFHGKPTTSGEIFSRHAMTAAHKTARLGTVCIVEDLRNGRRVLIRLNDRGPFVEGRIIDLSEKAARDLGMIHVGVVPVRLYFITAAIPIPRPGTED